MRNRTGALDSALLDRIVGCLLVIPRKRESRAWFKPLNAHVRGHDNRARSVGRALL